MTRTKTVVGPVIRIPASWLQGAVVLSPRDLVGGAGMIHRARFLMAEYGEGSATGANHENAPQQGREQSEGLCR